MPKTVPPQDGLEIECLDADMTRDGLIAILKRLKFENGFSVLKVDRHVRDYLVSAIKPRASR